MYIVVAYTALPPRTLSTLSLQTPVCACSLNAATRHRLDVNCLSDLPASMVHLERLEELCLTSNFFAHFPEFAMKMSGLKKVPPALRPPPPIALGASNVCLVGENPT